MKSCISVYTVLKSLDLQNSSCSLLKVVLYSAVSLELEYILSREGNCVNLFFLVVRTKTVLS